MMTEPEISVLKELSGDVKDLSGEVRTLASDLREHIIRDDSAWRDAAATHAEVFGLDGDPTRPGLKGQMRDVQATLRSHTRKFRNLQGLASAGLSKAWLVVVAIVGAVVGAVVSRFLR